MAFVMKKYFLVAVCLFVLAASGYGQTGQVLEDLTIESKLMKQTMAYSVYLPPDYQQSKRHYPVVYLLHGYSDNHNAWLQFGMVNHVLDQGIASGQLPAMIVIMPDALTTYYINSHNGKQPYEDYFIKELMPHIEKQYRIKSQKQFRAVSGLSMGGFGSLLIALKHHDLFGSCAAYSAAIRTFDDFVNRDPEAYKQSLQLPYGPQPTNIDNMPAVFVNNNLFTLFEKKAAEAKTVKWYIDCGDDDFLYNGNSQLHIHLRNLSIPHQYRVRDGAHNWTYWRQSVQQGLQFIGSGFIR